jgi:NAD(P)-dependent dehydrogenase (short-subunit alcohol dehydrogenase family)
VTTQPWQRGTEAGRRLEGRVALVTGAGSAPGLMGIGEAIALLFADQGASVGVVDISQERAEYTKALIDGIGGRGVAVVGDLTKEADSARCAAEVVDAFGHLDILVNCAAITGGGGSPATVDLTEWDAVMAVNLHAAVLAARYAIPHLQAAGGGAIINVASVAASRGHGAGAYAASKGALLALTRDWAYVHGREGIRVNCILPGHVFTPMGDQGPDEIRQRRRRAGLLGTEGDAWDVAWPAVFLASDEARWITGVEIPVDAGTTSSAAFAIGLLNDRSPE